MAPESAATEPDEQRGGSPAWMMTYGDSVTLLLTFFVLLLTFSTPDEEGFQELARGFMQGSPNPPLSEGESGQANRVEEEKRLRSARLDSEGADKPPMHTETPIDALESYYERLDVSELPQLEGGRLVRIPLVELFGTGSRLTPDGARILDYIVKVCRGKRHSLVVRALAGGGVSPEELERRSIAMAAQVSDYIQRTGGQTCRDVGVSNDTGLLGTQLETGFCEIILLEV